MRQPIRHACLAEKLDLRALALLLAVRALFPALLSFIAHCCGGVAAELMV